MSEQIPAPVEPTKTPEILLENSHYRAVHGRFLLGGEALNPEKTDLAVVTKESLGSFDKHNYDPFTSASTNERKQTALVEKGKLGEAVDVWSSDTAKVLSQDFSKKNGFDQAKAMRWHQSLAKIIGTDPKTISADQVKGLFQKYFSGEDNRSDIKLFVADVLKAYNNDLTAVEANLDCIQWLANIFGGQSSTMVRELVTAESLLINKPDQLVSELNQAGEDKITRINNINSDEKQLLKFVWQGETTPVKIDDGGEKAPPKIEQSDDEKQKGLYLNKKKDNADFILGATLDQINIAFKNMGIKTVNKEEFKKLKDDEKERSKAASQMVIGTARYYQISALLNEISRAEKDKLSKPEKEALDLDKELILLKHEGTDKEVVDEMQKKLDELLKQNNISIEALEKKIQDVVVEKKPEIMAIVDKNTRELQEKIDEWEGVEKPEEKKEEPPATETPATADEKKDDKPEDSPEEKQKKPRKTLKDLLKGILRRKNKEEKK